MAQGKGPQRAVGVDHCRLLGKPLGRKHDLETSVITVLRMDREITIGRRPTHAARLRPLPAGLPDSSTTCPQTVRAWERPRRRGHGRVADSATRFSAAACAIGGAFDDRRPDDLGPGPFPGASRLAVTPIGGSTFSRSNDRIAPGFCAAGLRGQSGAARPSARTARRAARHPFRRDLRQPETAEAIQALVLRREPVAGDAGGDVDHAAGNAAGDNAPFGVDSTIWRIPGFRTGSPSTRVWSGKGLPSANTSRPLRRKAGSTAKSPSFTWAAVAADVHPPPEIPPGSPRLLMIP